MLNLFNRIDEQLQLGWRNHPKKMGVLFFAVMFLAIFSTTFTVNLLLRGPRVEEKVVERVRVEEKLVERKREEQATQQQAVQVQTRIVYRDRVVKPDGTRVEREVETTATTAVTEQLQHRVVEEHREQERQTVKEVERQVTVAAPQPTWRVGLLAGAPIKLALPELHAGVIVERRLLGPISLGGLVTVPVQGGAPFVGLALTVELP